MSKKNAITTLSAITECPICGAALESGNIVAPRGIYWNKYTVLGDTAIISQFKNTRAPSLKCNNCNIIILGFEKKIKP